MKVSVDEALRRGQVEPVVTALLQALAQGQAPYAELMRTVEAAQGQPELLKRLRHKAVHSRPRDPRSWRVAVLCDRHLHDWAAAVASIRRCYALGDRDDQLRLTEASLLEMLGEQQEALDVLEGQWPEALAAKVWSVRGRVWLRMKAYSTLVDELGGWLESSANQQYAGYAGCWKALGQAYDHLGQPDKAMACFHRGNELRPKADMESDAMGAFLSAWGRETTLQPFQSCSPSSYTGPTPVFLVGFARSGTTLLEQALDAHPGICALEERPTIERALAAAQQLIQKRAEVRQSVAAAGSLPDKLAELLMAIGRADDNELEAIRKVYFDVVRASVDWPEGALLVDKLPLNLIHLPFIIRLFPGAKFIFALRDPADCVLSGYMQYFERNPAMDRLASLEGGARFYADVMGLFERYRQSLSLEDRLHFVHYEQLVSNWQDTVGAVLEFVGVGWHPQVEHYREHAARRGTIATPSYQAVVEPLRSRPTGRWRSYQHLLGDAFEPLEPYRRLWGYDKAAG